ncbi:pentapeptide repeat-containing protein [Argonema galeatum]|uniref:pentapeptide repeat-containing protein n=1 Tax=Argonema galeatum TaxID=2942762 RepID=UPI00201189CA|nr:pentapeptide repeat-containing protein [Argonema galeatum]MCL1464946.1 pentapeptide repeat-containing protein [Argonema galeatum A003/A1]
MAINRPDASRKFITTEPLGKSGHRGEAKVWDAVKSDFANRECIAYWRYPIFSKVGKTRKEPDILIADLEIGLIVIEVKSVTIDKIVAIAGHRWEFRNFYIRDGNPYEQAENQLFALLGYCDREPILRRKVNGRAIVALPLITEKQWQEKGFHQLPSCPPIIFQEHLLNITSPPTPLLAGEGSNSSNTPPNASREGGSGGLGLPLLKRIQQITPVIKGVKLNDEQWKLLLSVISGTPVFRKPPNNLQLKLAVSEILPPIPGSRASILAKARQHLSEFDLQQEHIGKQIPPGSQRIRGIAGSGKTVLLCQKAAHMHLKYPNWDIALVFFSRSLYDPITKQLDKWLRRFSSGEVEYKPNNEKLRVFHAWGAKNQPGLYSIICEAAGVQRLTAYDTDSKQPNEALAEVCSLLLRTAVIPQIFDAILIDEGQDLIVDDEFKFEDKQPFYWMAYQALRSVDPQHPEQRRLIWAYDEAQSLESLNMPTAGELFGDELAHLVTGEYPDGIKKTEVMHRCYRTPSPILTVAHGIGMGLLRSGRMLSGITRTEDWKAIGYEVTGRFTRGQRITLKRLSENSPNIIPQLWEKPVIEFEIYRDRQSELTALAQNIIYNLKHDNLNPSRDILVIVLGSFFEATILETHVAEFLISQGINIFIPSTTNCNILKADSENRDPNKFWCEGGVTVSRIHRAKGNEADIVYLVGLDNIAKEESNIILRNQLFIALTRTRGWVKLSGIDNYPMYEEMRRVIKSGDTFTFTFNQRPKREISLTDAGELLNKYAAGTRNFQGADLRYIQLPGADLRDANLISTQLTGANLRNAQLDGVKLVIADLSNADLSNASLRKAKLMGAILSGADLSGADLSRADLSDADLRNAKLVGATLVGANLSAADLSGTDLTGADIAGAELSDANLAGIQLGGATMPDRSIHG